MKEKFTEIFSKLSNREKLLAVIAAAYLIYVVAAQVVDPLQQAFIQQSDRLKKTRQSLAVLPNQLTRYKQLNFKKTEIENQYSGVVFQNGVLSHIESLIKSVAQITNSSDYSIRSLSTKAFGGNYEREPFRIQLNTDSHENLLNFLEKLTRGNQALTLTSLKISKAPNRTKLIVVIEVSNFKPLNSTDA